MIDSITTDVLIVIADVYVATGRTTPAWVIDALLSAASDPATPFDLVRRATAVLREVHGQESITA